MKIVVLDGYTLCGEDLSFSALENLGEVTVYDRTAPQDTAARMGDAQIVLTNKVLITRDVMDACPALRYIGVMATGYNVVDIAEAKRRGIVVTNAPAYSTQAVVQHTFAFILHAMSHVAAYDAQVKQGAWENCPDFSFRTETLEEVVGKTLGIVGFGHIGQMVARTAIALGMRVMVHTPHPNTLWEREGLRYVTMEELASQCDILTLHCPLTEETRNLIGPELLALMCPSIIVINTARGPLVDEAAMADALRSGRVRCFMADVLSTEPPAADNPLLSAPNTVLTPHIAWAARQTRERLMAIVLRNVRAFVDDAPINVVNG